MSTSVRTRRADVDPRIAERREAVKRERTRKLRRRWLVAAVAVAVLGGLAGGAWGIARSSLLDVDRIVVIGAERTPEAEVVEASGVEVGMAMVDLDPDRARDHVSELPWIHSVRVERDWPSLVRIRVTERVPVAVLAAPQDRWLLVDVEGRVLGEAAEPDAWVELRGGGETPPPGGQTAAIAHLASVAAAMPEALGAMVEAVSRDEGEAWLVLFAGGRVRLGDASQIAEKLEAALTVLVRVDDRCLSTIDVRVPDAPTVRRDPACAGPLEPPEPEPLLPAGASPPATTPASTLLPPATSP